MLSDPQKLNAWTRSRHFLIRFRCWRKSFGVLLCPCTGNPDAGESDGPFRIRYKTGDIVMRNRKKQQELIKAKIIREEKLELRDSYGKKDPTPYEAVKNMIRRGKTTADCRMKRVAARRT